MKQKYTSQRLELSRLSLSDSEFIQQLVNTPGWLKFIGERNVKSIAMAIEYVDKIIQNPILYYWTVRYNDIPIGIITIIQRDYLPLQDFGFAFLPQYEKQGFAFEAATAVLNDFKTIENHPELLATTVPANENSIRLLEKLGFGLKEKIVANDVPLLLYKLNDD
ncbi:GNAT family N-acetyltransferase [Pedobacter panaciterrae]|uniref:GNAT family N-acetyltransferase n=1 Tax=Pedobacter panaciterrae TaxID=363849 RepID=A0ABU8NTH1_9SPHI|nr:GNAT family N-acetyltransferase [uncultured Pedobacter sp.]